MGVTVKVPKMDLKPDSVGDLEIVELELMKLVRHLETFSRKSSLYQEIDRAGYLALRTLDGLGPSCINGLARELRLDSSTVTRQVSALESGGFVTRQIDPSDRRSWLIDLTPAGRKVMRTVERGRRRAIDSILNGWRSDEVQDLARMITKLNQALFDSAAERSAPAPGS